MIQTNNLDMLWKSLVIAMLVLMMCGCGIGKKNVLFVTKTSLGIDIDSSPPTFDVAFDRKEGTIAPVFEDGQVLSQMSGFSTKEGIMNQAVGQSFATGTAAELMSKYLITDSALSVAEQIPIGELTTVSKLTRNGEPERYFFGTDTSFGLRINFGAETGWIPNSLSIGYKRKELAYVPLREKSISGGVEVSLPSLLTTHGFENQVSATEDSLLLRQFFATGMAANYLAAIPSIRQEVVPKMMPEARPLAEFARQKGFATTEKQTRIKSLLGLVDKLSDSTVYELNLNIPVPDGKADAVVSRMDPACQRLATRDCNGDGLPDSGGAGAVGSPDVAKRMIQFRIVMSGQRSDEELNAWEAALKSTK